MDSLLLSTFIYLAAAVLAVPVAKRLGLGSVLGYLIAGVIIGPHLLGLVGSQSSDLQSIAEFGVVMMLFVIGLELKPALLWQLRIQLLGLGGLQFLLTTVAITGCGIAADFPWQTSLAVGMTLALSPTAIVLQTLNEKKLLKTTAGQSTFSVLLFQDIAGFRVEEFNAELLDDTHGGVVDFLNALCVDRFGWIVVNDGQFPVHLIDDWTTAPYIAFPTAAASLSGSSWCFAQPAYPPARPCVSTHQHHSCFCRQSKRRTSDGRAENCDIWSKYDVLGA